MIRLARILLLMELAGLALFGLGIRFTNQSTFVTESTGKRYEENQPESDQEFYGIGIEKGAKTLFWFHKEAGQRLGEASSP